MWALCDRDKLIIITDYTKRMNLNVHEVWKSKLGLVISDKFDPINQLITL